MKVTLRWATPDIDKEIAYEARISSDNRDNPSIAGLLNYCMREGHVSPFDMANVCLEIDTTRDIGRQILRHSSINFQEFSQRYQDVSILPDAELRECRLQDVKNRQNSIEIKPYENEGLTRWWDETQQNVMSLVERSYEMALKSGIAKEQARALLPEGLTSSRMDCNGTMRSWIFYLKQRLHESTQKEHRLIAQEVLAILRTVAPVTMLAFFPEDV